MNKGDENGMSSYATAPLGVGSPTVETDATCQAFAHWLTELKARNSKTLQEMLSEMSIIRDGITSNNMDLSDFKRNSTGISQQMQTQLTDLREKLTNAFSEITALVKAKTTSDQEMMQDINSLQQSLSVSTQELEALKRSYSQAHSQLWNSLIQIKNHLEVTNNEVGQAKESAERVHRETTSRLADLDTSLRGIEDDLRVGNSENRNQMGQLQEDIARIHEAISNVSAEFNDHKRAAHSVHNKFQSAVWSLEEGHKRQQQVASAGAQAANASSVQAAEAALPTASSLATFPASPQASYHPGRQPPQGYPTYAQQMPSAASPLGTQQQPLRGSGPMLAPGMPTRSSLQLTVPGPMQQIVPSGQMRLQHRTSNVF
eukprot:TRINITY_DN117_c0_g1_i1.p1 TRINITY_DN117_c0_g1~~TRINITY_DN117_c0_g1_i1.p1  ORF type:complete len:373 (+),score=76.07 TRINITY_DN117_c0_g1_i1:81-1199(+)